MKPVKETEDIVKPVKKNLDIDLRIALDFFFKVVVIIACLVHITNMTQITKCVNHMAHSEYFDRFSTAYV